MKVTLFPELYKKTSTGAIQCWRISVQGRTITTKYGQVEGKMQSTSDPISEGKNIGKKGETTPEQQALKEAEAKWTKQKKAGYVEKIADAVNDVTDDIIEGGILPMLANKYEDYFNYDTSDIQSPVYVQPKLDGIRCVAIFLNGETTLWSRTRKRITSCPHIEEAVTKACKLFGVSNDLSVILDGELYVDKFANDFEKIVSAVRKKNPSKESKVIEYHIYDTVANLPFSQRSKWLGRLLASGKLSLRSVPTTKASSKAEINDLHMHFVELGYEGAMVRLDGINYEHKRSSQLLKLKTFQDDEFEIVGVENGRGKLQGHAGAFICKTSKGKLFNVKMMGATERLKDYLDNFKRYKGKQLTVKYQGLTSDGIPRFPVGKSIREDGL